jgi:hypothetical protein
MQTSIQEFTLALLAYKGALVEADDRSAGVFLGAELGAALGMNEYQRLVFDPLIEEPGALRVDYDAPSFEAIGQLTASMGSLACVRVSSPELQTLTRRRNWIGCCASTTASSAFASVRRPRRSTFASSFNMT